MNPLKQEKKNKREQLLKKGVDPYPHTYRKECDTADVHSKYGALSPGESLAGDLRAFAGRVMRKRDMGKAAFFDIQDQTGRLQCYIKKQDFSENAQKAGAADLHRSRLKPPIQTLNPWDIWKLTDIGDIVGVQGYPFRTRKGELSLRVKDLKILCKTLEPLPEKYHGLEDTELKCRFRHLDLIMNEKSREVFQTRSQIIREIRSFMNDKGFMEVETPVLQPVYGGALAAPFETRFRRLNQKMYLKISPEIYLKKLIVGGFEKIYEIGKNFRNEGIDRTHNPEFTMMEYYEAYTDYKYQMEQFEELIRSVVKKVRGALKMDYLGKELDFSGPWEKITLKEAVLKYGGVNVDQADTWDLAEKIESLDKKSGTLLSFKRLLGRRALSFSPAAGSAETGGRTAPLLSESAPLRETKQQLSLWLKQGGGDLLSDKASSFQRAKTSAKGSLTKQRPSAFPEQSGNNFEVFLRGLDKKTAEELEEIRDAMIGELFELTAEKNLWNPVFVTDFPLASSPLTKSRRREGGADGAAFEEAKKYFRTVERFEPYIAGMEIGNAYTELNDPVKQRERLEKQKRFAPRAEEHRLGPGAEVREVPHPVDENFLHALEVGMPPTGGVGLGIERLVMILTNQAHLRNCILFPFLREKTE